MPNSPTLPRPASFWLLGTLLVVLLFSATAPSPLYAVYQEMWRFSSVTLTAIYGSYAFAGIAALLVAGRLSDYLGRRLVLGTALLVNVGAMLTFVAASDVLALFAGRTLTGIGTGIASGVIGAWLIDLQPPGNARLASLINGSAPLLGLGLGGFMSGLLVEYGPDPTRLVFWLLAAVYAASFVAILLLPDPIERRAGWAASLRPSIGIPAGARTLFVASAPALVGMWALAGLYFSLGPSVAISIQQTESRIAGGVMIVALAGGGALASIAARNRQPAVVLTGGCIVLMAGVATTLIGVWWSSISVLYIGSLVAGMGLGPAFSAFVRIVTPLAPPEQRGGLIAAIYVATYLSFSVPAVLAGAATTLYGLRMTTFGYGIVVMLLAAVTTMAVWRRLARATTTP